MAIMFGNGTVAFNSSEDVKRTVMVRLTDEGELPDYFTADIYDSAEGAVRKKVYMQNKKPDGVDYSASGVSIEYLTKEAGEKITKATFGGDASADASAWTGFADETLAGQKVFVTYTVKATTKTITISGDSFPGTYYITGDTYARSDVTGDDQFFQFIIPKAKVTSENTITLEAEGDPSVFNMNLTVLRPESGEMMKLVQYDLNAPAVG
jgi:hypothetical protein